MSLPKMDAKLLRLPSSCATEINFQSRYPEGILVRKIGMACCSACPDAAALKATTPTIIAISNRADPFNIIPPSSFKDGTGRSVSPDSRRQFDSVKIVEGNRLEFGPLS